MRPRPVPDDSGLTLLELLVAVAILGIAAVAMTGAMGNLVLASETHRGLSATDAVMRDTAESMRNEAALATWSCDTTADDFLPPAPSGFTLTSSFVWLDPITGSSVACATYATLRCPTFDLDALPPECTPGYMRVVVTLQKQDGDSRHVGAASTSDVVIRRGND